MRSAVVTPRYGCCDNGMKVTATARVWVAVQELKLVTIVGIHSKS